MEGLRSVTEVMEGVNRVLKLPDVEVLRDACIGYTTDVYKKTGNKAYVEASSIIPIKNKTGYLPSGFIKLIDAFWKRDNSKIPLIATPMGSSFANELSFRIDGGKIRTWSNNVDKVLIEYKSVPLSEDGEILVIDEIFTACVDYATFNELLTKGSVVKQDYATLNAVNFWERKSNKSIDEATAFMNSSNFAKDRYLNLANIVIANR